MTEKIEEQPHAKQRWAYHLSPRCGARRKYDGQPCQSPAVNGRVRCRLHGGAKGSGAPIGNNNAYVHGYYQSQQIMFRRIVKDSIEFQVKTQWK